MSNYFKENDINSFNYGSDSSGKNIFHKFQLYYNAINDKLQYYKSERWISIAVLVLLYLIRILYTQGSY